MATATVSSTGATPSSVITVNERRWSVIGFCLNKLLTPVLRKVLGKEIPVWYNNLCLLPNQINNQTYKKHAAKLPPSLTKLNYGNINKNYDNHKFVYNAYDYKVKDPESLAKLFVQPFMAKFNGFDQTMDLSAALTLVCEADPFHTSGAAGQATIVRSGVRNEWAHCDFSHWSDVNYRTCIQDIESLVKKLNLSNADESDFVNELNNWKDKGVQLCCGQAVDADLLKLIKTEVAHLYDSVEIWREENQNALTQLMERLKIEIHDRQETEATIGNDIEYLKFRSQQLDALQNQVAKLASGSQEAPYLFMLPTKTEWFSGREFELENLHILLTIINDVNASKVQIASVCGLGGSGKTSLAAEYAHRWKDYYDGGVFWLSGEDEATFANSLDEHAVHLGTLLETSSGTTLVKTLDAISKIQKPWLLVLDDMDEYKLCSNIEILLSGQWKRRVNGSGHILITTRRKPKVMCETIRGFKESQCLQLECFNPEDGKEFVFKRTGINCDEETSSQAASLVETLGGLPLAMEQACAYIKYLSCNLSMYLEQYKRYSLKLLDEKDASSASLYKSPERLAVRTTWLLNFQYIKHSRHGNFAVRFLHACSFFNPKEIQEDLINPGKPPIEDEAYRDFVDSPLGSLAIVEMLTDFSLFRKNRTSCLTVHRLVQEIIRENFSPEEKVLSFVDAIRSLSFAFSRSRSPDDLLTSVINKNHDRASLQATDPSLLHEWHKMCLHAHEIRKFLVVFLKSSQVLDQRVVIPEVARLVYECALHFNVNNEPAEAKEAIDFAHAIIRLGKTYLSNDDLTILFPHQIPMPDLVRKFISYSCVDPHNINVPSAVEEVKNIMSIAEVNEKRLQGNTYFKDGHFQKAVAIYTSLINMTKGTTTFDPTLLSNRASAYIKLQEFEIALKDAEDYISRRPKCCKGYARKAVALHGLKRFWDAARDAALAYYFERDIFSRFPPFKHLFLPIKDRIVICDTSMSSRVPYIVDRKFYSQVTCEPDLPGKILIFEPGDYIFQAQMYISDCILIGVEDGATERRPHFSFEDESGMSCYGYIMAVNVSLTFDVGCCKTQQSANATFINCSFTSHAGQNEQAFLSFLSLGLTFFTNCHFENSNENALCILGKSLVEKCVFSGNGSSAVQVNGELEIKGCKLHGNKFGVDIRQYAGCCRIVDCEIYDNRYHGITVCQCPNVNVVGNRIYQNDRHGIYLDGVSFTHIESNEIFENCWGGISTMDNARCHVINNKIYRNKYGGVLVVPVGPGPKDCHSIVENNEISDNDGPGISDEMMFRDVPSIPLEQTLNEHIFFDENREQMRKAKCKGNKERNNDKSEIAKSENEWESLGFCAFCAEKKSLRYCKGCYSVRYCSKDCQRCDWRRHKSVCASFLEASSAIVNVVPKERLLGPTSDEYIIITFNEQAPGLDPKGPEYASPPKYGKRFIVKVQAGDSVRQSNLGSSLLVLYDRSMTIHGDLDWKHCPLYHIVQQCGKNSYGVGWKKMFFWAILYNPDNNLTLRVFTKGLPSYQSW